MRPSTADILLARSPEQVAWTTVNVAEAIPGCFTPLAWTATGDSMERALQACFHTIGALSATELGVSDQPEQRFIDVFHGYAAANVDMIRMVADRTPGTSGDDFERQIFGHAREGIPNQSELRRYPAAVAKTARTAATLKSRVTTMRAIVDPWWSAATSAEAIADTDGAARRMRQAIDVMDVAIRDHMIVRMIAAGIFDQVVALGEATGAGNEALTLISGGAALEELRLLDDLWSLSRGRIEIDAFLAVHGYHGPSEGEAYSRPWREDRAPLEALVGKYASLDESGSPAAVVRAQQGRREQATRELLASLPRHRRAGTRLLFGLARGAIPLLESTKSAFLKSIDGVRAAGRTRGALLVGQGVLGEADDVFFLTLDEALGEPAPDLADLAGERREEHAVYRDTVIPDFWIGNPEPAPRAARKAVAAAATEAAGDPAVSGLAPGGGTAGVVTGLAAGGGSATGTARVVTDVASLAEIEPGEILVCPFTDPAWSAYMVLASALVIDIGGPVSHGAIVARELGIPCVINTATGTQVIRTGDRLTVDGSTGHVTIG